MVDETPPAVRRRSTVRRRGDTAPSSPPEQRPRQVAGAAREATPSSAGAPGSSVRSSPNPVPAHRTLFSSSPVAYSCSPDRLVRDEFPSPCWTLHGAAAGFSACRVARSGRVLRGAVLSETRSEESSVRGARTNLLHPRLPDPLCSLLRHAAGRRSRRAESGRTRRGRRMLVSLARHGFGAVLLAVVMEELGPPLPMPTDASIVFAGTAAWRNLPQPFALFVALSLASAVGACGLYAAARRPDAGRALRTLRASRAGEAGAGGGAARPFRLGHLREGGGGPTPLPRGRLRPLQSVLPAVREGPRRRVFGVRRGPFWRQARSSGRQFSPGYTFRRGRYGCRGSPSGCHSWYCCGAAVHGAVPRRLASRRASILIAGAGKNRRARILLRKRQGEGRAFPRLALGLYGAAVGLGDLAGDGEPEPGPALRARGVRRWKRSKISGS